MRKALHPAGLTLLVLSLLCTASAPQTYGRNVSSSGGGSGRAFGTISGLVKDNNGNPLAGAVISLIKEGANAVIKETRSAADGSFHARIAPGRYNVRAIADGFNEALFNSVQVRASDEVVYHFNLERVGQGRTAPERRRDRDNVRWRIMATQTRRSIFQEQQGEDEDIRRVLGSVDAAADVDEAETNGETETATLNDESALNNENSESKHLPRTQGVVETYAATSSNSSTPVYAGMNFAFVVPASNQVDLIFMGQTGTGRGASQRLETTARVRAGERHRVSLSIGADQLGAASYLKKMNERGALGQVSLRAVDEWIVRDGIVVVLGLDYSRFLGASTADSFSPRIGFQMDANARTRVKASYAPGGEERNAQSSIGFEGHQITFKQPVRGPIALVDGRAVMERTRRFEFGVERVIDNESSFEATAFFDTTNNRGVGLLSTPLAAFNNENGEALINVANQQGAARGMRVVYTRRVSRILNASAGYSFGRGQSLTTKGLTNPAAMFQNDFFQSAALQLGADLGSGTHVRTVFRFSPKATVFAIDPFAGRLAVYDPSLSIMVTQDLPSFGLPLRAEAVIDARNLLDTQTSTEDSETLLQLNSAARRSVRGGISVRF
ncbi:MAG TPA: carboxypeptidase regulatory-like domain-containing protein [Pyrinomonadaceae bacterium]|jgi:hypothetical protein|nr:carboxypeptidase regulatory-like domain-containing protein [Pyrinomonadaceae bacterium]